MSAMGQLSRKAAPGHIRSFRALVCYSRFQPQASLHGCETTGRFGLRDRLDCRSYIPSFLVSLYR
jgi:hypothetical protein